MKGYGTTITFAIIAGLCLPPEGNRVWAQQPGVRNPVVQRLNPAPALKAPLVSGKVSVDGVSPMVLRVEPGGREETVLIRGANLNKVTKVEVISGSTALPGVVVKLGPASTVLLRLAILAGGEAKPGEYLLRLVAADGSLDLPARSVRVLIVAPSKPVAATPMGSFQPVVVSVPALKVIWKPGGPPPQTTSNGPFVPVTIQVPILKVIGKPGGPPPQATSTGPFVPVTIQVPALKVIGKPGGPPPQTVSTGPFVPVTIHVNPLKVIGK